MCTVLTSVHFGLGTVLCVSLGSRGLVCEPSILLKDAVELHDPLLAKFPWICYFDLVNFYFSYLENGYNNNYLLRLVVGLRCYNTI